MRSFRGTSNNLDQSIICKLIESIADREVLYRGVIKDSKGFEQLSCTIIDESLSQSPLKGCKYFFEISAKNELNSGDIVLLEPSGKGTILYENDSFSNSLFLTEQCNCKCIICPQPPKTDSQNHISIALEIINLLSGGTKVLGITGGEPTLMWDGLLKILNKCNENIPNASLQLLTNGRVLQNYQKAEQLSQYSKNNLFVCIPLYADVDLLHDKIVNSNGAFYETINGINNLARLNVPIEIRIVINKMNFKRLPLWSEFIYRTFPFVQHVALMGLEPFGFAKKNLNDVWVDPIDYQPFLEKAVKNLNRRGINFSIFNHQLCTLPQPLWQFSCKSISEWKNIYFPICSNCDVSKNCGGFFSSSKNIKSKGIKAISMTN